MLTKYLSALVLLCLQLVAATPVLPRQFTPTSSSPPSATESLNSCAPQALYVSQFSISNIQGAGPKTISFNVDNYNFEGPAQAYCSYTFPNGTNSSSITDPATHSCNRDDTTFNYVKNNGSSYLIVQQNMFCDDLWPGASVWIFAAAVVVPPLPSYDPATYDESDTGSVYLPVLNVALASAEQIPACGQTCLQSVTSASSCTGQCVCASTTYADSLLSCLNTGCYDGQTGETSASAVQATIDYMIDYCQQAFGEGFLGPDGLEEPITEGEGEGEGEGEDEPVRKE